MKFNPSQDWILIDDVKEARKSGIVLPENVKFEWEQGRILAIGPGKYSMTGELVAPPYNIGDKVIYSGPTAMEIEVSGEKIKLIGANNIMGIVEE